MENNKIETIRQNVLEDIIENIDFKNGVIQEISQEKKEMGYILDVRWKRDVHFVMYINQLPYVWYYASRNGERVSSSYINRKYNDAFYKSVQHLVDEIEYGSFNYKKTVSERIAEIIQDRQLTSYMNDTKWKEFVHAMDEEMSVAVPYAYKTLFEEDREDLFFDKWYDCESFNGYHYKSVEWVKVKPKFHECKHRGMLIEDEKIYYDVEEEFLNLMKKYSITCEKEEETGLYVIYGYK